MTNTTKPDYTRLLLLAKHGSPAMQEHASTILKALYAAPAVQAHKPVEDIQKSALPAIAIFKTEREWLQAITPLMTSWPQDLAASVLSDMLAKHRGATV